jgi:hypothetical protein
MTNTSTTEGATSNKRTRDGSNEPDTANAASGGAAASVSDLDARLGTRLMPLKPLLVLQPDELKGTLISSAKEMLDLRVTIKQRQESSARFDKPSTDPTTGAVQKDKDGQSLPFIPSSL